MLVTDDSWEGTFSPVCSGNVFGYMKYSFPCLLSGSVHIYLPDYFMIPVTSSEKRKRRVGNDSFHVASDGGWRKRGDARIRGADHQNQGLFLI